MSRAALCLGGVLFGAAFIMLALPALVDVETMDLQVRGRLGVLLGCCIVSVPFLVVLTLWDREGQR